MGNIIVYLRMRAAAVIIILAATLPSQAQNMIEGYEYWFDNEHTDKVLTPVSAAVENSISITVNTSGLSEGVHAVSLRAFDQNGCYSSVICHLFYKTVLTPGDETNISDCQYWFDDNYAGAEITALTPQDKISLTEIASADDLDEGIHLLNIRFRDNHKAWSSILTWSFYKVPAGTVSDNVITSYRYWLNDDSGSAVYRSLAAPGSRVLVMDDIDFSTIPQGMYTINIQFRDAAGGWSQVITAEMTKTPLPRAGFSHTEEQKCDTTILSFTNSSIDADVYQWDFGDGTSDTARNPAHPYTVAGIYKVTLIARDTITGVTSTKETDMNVSVRKVDTGVLQDGFVLTAIASDATFQWLACNNAYAPVEGAASNSFTPVVNGSYAARIEQNGCTDTTACYEVLPVGTENNSAESGISVSPNPTGGKFTIRTNRPEDHITVKIFDQGGRLVKISEFYDTAVMEMTLSEQPGIYFVVVSGEGLRKVFKLLKE